jgi:hypothetical protein
VIPVFEEFEDGFRSAVVTLARSTHCAVALGKRA